MHYTLTVSNGMAMVAKYDDNLKGNALAIGYGVTNDQAVADALRAITFDRKEV